MANTDPEALKAAAAAYAASNASLKDYDPKTQQATDLQWEATQGGPNTHPAEPVTSSADVAVLADITSGQKNTDSKK